MVGKHTEQCTEDTNSNIHMILKSLRGKIKDWSKLERNNLDVKIREVEKCMEDVDRGVTDTLDVVELHKVLEELYDQKVDMLRQKARVNWAFQGDRKSKFYHQCINRRNC